MFIGHFAVAFAAKKVSPRPSLATYFIAAQFLDLLWPVLLLLGVEHVRIDPGNTRMTPLDFYHYPISHSLIAVLGWSLLWALVSYWRVRERRVSFLLGACVLSHWVLDLIVHRPDLPLGLNGGPYLGFGLWNVPAVAILIELGLFITGVSFYLVSTFAKHRVGKVAPLGLAALLLMIWIGNFLGPLPPDAQSIAVVGNLQWLFVVAAFWVDRSRLPNRISQNA